MSMFCRACDHWWVALAPDDRACLFCGVEGEHRYAPAIGSMPVRMSNYAGQETVW